MPQSQAEKKARDNCRAYQIISMQIKKFIKNTGYKIKVISCLTLIKFTQRNKILYFNLITLLVF